MKCDTCGKLFGGMETDIVYDRGYWWHRPCAKMLTESMVDYPSAGKLIPETIMEGDDDEPSRDHLSTKYHVERQDKHGHWISLFYRPTLDEARRNKARWEKSNKGFSARIVEEIRRVVENA